MKLTLESDLMDITIKEEIDDEEFSIDTRLAWLVGTLLRKFGAPSNYEFIADLIMGMFSDEMFDDEKEYGIDDGLIQEAIKIREKIREYKKSLRTMKVRDDDD